MSCVSICSLSLSSAHPVSCVSLFFFFFNDTAPTEIYTLSLHDALPISAICVPPLDSAVTTGAASRLRFAREIGRAHVLNSSHMSISYAVFCLKKKKKKKKKTNIHK